MTKIKAIIFDFDGTIANTLPNCYDAFQCVFKAFDNKRFSEKEINAMFGPSETGIIKENLTSTYVEQAIELYYEKYSENHRLLVEENDEINDLLKYIKENGIKLGIVTGKATRSLNISLKALKMEELFDVIITGDDVIDPKPHPEGIIKALSLLNVRSDEAIFVGDSEADIVAGIQANIYTIGVQWLANYQTDEFVTQPDQVFKEIKEFKQMLHDFSFRISNRTADLNLLDL